MHPMTDVIFKHKSSRTRVVGESDEREGYRIIITFLFPLKTIS